jgi:hypothetical protein
MMLLLLPFLYVGGMVILMLVAFAAGRMLRARRQARAGDDGAPGTSTLDGALFALFGLLLAFTFSGAASRLDARRDLIRLEANAIGTAYLRVDLVPAAYQPKLRELFRDYVDARLAVYANVDQSNIYDASNARVDALQQQLWATAVPAAAAAQGTQATMLLLPALNDVIDIVTTRRVAIMTHPPLEVFGLLLALAVACSLISGYTMNSKSRGNRIHITTFVVTMVMTVYVIVDLEMPRFGFITITSADVVLSDVGASIKADIQRRAH